MANTLLKLERVTKFYGHKLIFKKLDLEIESGTGILITGANGAGKSTLLRIMAGLASISDGKVAYINDPVIAYLGHATFIYPRMTAIENLAFWSKAYNIKVSRQELENVLKKVNLLQAAHEGAGTFSRGMAQRLNFARIMLLKPDLFLLDEPFTGMDANSRATLFYELKQYKAAGAAIVMVSHAPAEDGYIADEIFALENHKLAAKCSRNAEE